MSNEVKEGIIKEVDKISEPFEIQEMVSDGDASIHEEKEMNRLEDQPDFDTTEVDPLKENENCMEIEVSMTQTVREKGEVESDKQNDDESCKDNLSESSTANQTLEETTRSTDTLIISDDISRNAGA